MHTSIHGLQSFGIPEHSPPKSRGKHDPKTAPEIMTLLLIRTEQPPFFLQRWIHDAFLAMIGIF